MTFFSILFALLIEQLRPLRSNNWLYDGIRQLAAHVQQRFDAGHVRYGGLAWCTVMAAVLVPVMLVYWLCWHIGPLMALIWNIVIVYLTLGLRHYSHFFTRIQMALAEGDVVTARQILADWTGQQTALMDVPEIARISIERAVLTSHRHVFGVFFWFLIPIGPAGAVLYRVADFLARAWSQSPDGQAEPFGLFAGSAFYWIDWIPARLSAAAFAVVGNFEEAIYNWRSVAEGHSTPDQIMLASAAGAIGVQLAPFEQTIRTDVRAYAHPAQSMAGMGGMGMASPQDFADPVMVDIGSTMAEPLNGTVPGPSALRSTVGLIWRALLVWMMMLLLLSVTIWVS